MLKILHEAEARSKNDGSVEEGSSPLDRSVNDSRVTNWLDLRIQIARQVVVRLRKATKAFQSLSALQNGALERKWTLYEHILLRHIFYCHSSFIYVVNVTCDFPYIGVKSIFTIGLGFVFSLLSLFEKSPYKMANTTPCTTKKMAVLQARSIASYFPSAFLLFLLGLMSETKWGAHGWSNSSLIYVLCFGVFSFTGPFGHWDVSEALSDNISLKLTLLFFLPSNSPCQRFGLRAACLETAAAFGRSIQDSEDSHGGEKPRERENWSVSLCVAGSTNHPGLRRIATMTDMFVYVLCWVIFYF